MARSIAAAARQIKDQLDQHVTPADIHAACQAAGHDWRRRVLDPVRTVQALLAQILHATAMTGVSRLVGVAFSASAYCQALQRLPVAVLRTLLRQAVARQRRATADLGRWRGHRVFSVDGSSCAMPDAAPLQRRFGQPSGQKPCYGYCATGWTGAGWRRSWCSRTVRGVCNRWWCSGGRCNTRS